MAFHYRWQAVPCSVSTVWSHDLQEKLPNKEAVVSMEQFLLIPRHRMQRKWDGISGEFLQSEVLFRSRRKKKQSAPGLGLFLYAGANYSNNGVIDGDIFNVLPHTPVLGGFGRYANNAPFSVCNKNKWMCKKPQAVGNNFSLFLCNAFKLVAHK